MAGALQHRALVPGRQVAVTVDVHVRPRRRAVSQLRFGNFGGDSLQTEETPSRLLLPVFARGSSEESRLPRWIYNAECLTAGCLSLQGEGEDAALEAAPIYYPTLVLHR